MIGAGTSQHESETSNMTTDTLSTEVTDGFHLVIDVIDRVPKLRTKAAHLKEEMKDAIIDNLRYAHEQGTDRPELANWTWPY